jgi:hypothetical protein
MIAGSPFLSDREPLAAICHRDKAYNIGKALPVRPLAESLPCIAFSKSAELVCTGS